MTGGPELTATYRIQMHPRWMRLRDVLEAVPYWAELGISHLYLSPVLEPRAGSEHGYDVVNPGRLNPGLGNEEDLRALAAALQERGMGLVLDIVPNHMAASVENPWWRSTLQWGLRSRYAAFFDIDWRPENRSLWGKVLLPILTRPYPRALVEGEVRVVPGEGVHVPGAGNSRVGDGAFPERNGAPRLRCGEVDLPLHPATWARAQALLREAGHKISTRVSRAPVPPPIREIHRVVKSQRYVPDFWRTGMLRINYRRFFDVNELVALRMEQARVFRAVHHRVLTWARKGWVQGVRVDHVDGLYDPGAYLRRLRRSLPSPSRYILVEKILSPGETLPPDWPVEGTTGYEFLNALQRALISWSGYEELAQKYHAFTGVDEEFPYQVYEAKRQVVEQLFPSELRRLERRLAALASRDRQGRYLARKDLEAALVELSAALDRYRTYIRLPSLQDAEREALVEATARAGRWNPQAPRDALRFLLRVLTMEPAVRPGGRKGGQRLARRRFAMAWQQFTGPVMAKGLEDTALYRYAPLAALNEVGGGPEAPATPEAALEAFHRLNEHRLQHHPLALSATSTHDTKRSEDVRSRLIPLSEWPQWWNDLRKVWHRLNGEHKVTVQGVEVPDGATEIFLYQTLLGAWPLEDMAAEPGSEGRSAPRSFVARIQAYMLKAVREGKVHTRWLDPERDFEEALARFIHTLLEEEKGEAFRASLRGELRRVAPWGAFFSLAQVVLKVAAPGVSDFYQGQELWDFSLVDPDNRRPVDLSRRVRLLQEIHGGAIDPLSLSRELQERWMDGRLKLYVTWQALRLRRERPALFLRGEYLPLAWGEGTSPGASLRGEGREGVSARPGAPVLGFFRRWRQEWILAAVPRGLGERIPMDASPFQPGTWEQAMQGLEALLPWGAPRRWRHVFTGEQLDVTRGKPGDGGEGLALDILFRRFPVALLVAEE